MRGFVITTCLFIILILCIVLNYNFVRDVHDTMNELTEMIKPEKQAQNKTTIDELYEYWEKKNTLLSVSVSFREIDELSTVLDCLRAANEMGNELQIAIYKERLQNAIDAIVRLEQISVKSII